MTTENKAERPEPATIKATRQAARLTPREAGALVHASSRLWRMWEQGRHAMPLASWELFNLKLTQAGITTE